MKPREAKLTLLDRARVLPSLRPAAKAVWEQRYNARRFIFDREASRRVGEMLHDCVDLMVDNIEFARPAYPNAYYELDSQAFWQGWRPETPADKTADSRVGFLLYEGLAVVLAAGPVFETTDRGLTQVQAEAVVCGMSFRINRPQSVPFTKLTGLSEKLADLTKVSYVFGGLRKYGNKIGIPQNIHHYLNDSTEVILPELHGAWTHSQIAAHYDVMPAYADTKPKEMVSLSFLGGGDAMTLTTMLLLLNQPSKYVALTHVQRERGIWRGKLHNFKEHHVVTLHLSRQQHVRDMFHTTDRASPKRHKVGGHFMNFNKSSGCEHAWEPVGPERTHSGDFKRYWCPTCLQRRTWVENFSRGSGGEVTTEYHVTE